LIKKPLIDNQIRGEKVRVIDETGKQIGIFSLEKALELAREHNLDLVQVTEKVDPPVCKLLDYGKYLYQLQKRGKGNKPKKSELKSVRLSFSISSHDLETKANLVKNFLEKGDKVRIELPLRGREKGLSDFAKEKMENFLETLKNSISFKIERELKKEPRGLTIIISK